MDANESGMESLNRQLRVLLDRDVIHQMVIGYATARDTTDPRLYRELFAPDAQVWASGDRLLSDGLQQILAKVENDQRRFNPAILEMGSDPAEPPYGIMRHLVANVLITIDGDFARSHYTVTTLAHHAVEQKPEICSVTRVEDHYSRRASRWWIIRSTLTFEWENDAMGRALQVGPYTPEIYRNPALPGASGPNTQSHETP